MTDKIAEDWTPISVSELLKLVEDETPRHNPIAERLWSSVRIEPCKWQLHPRGDMGGGFWVVGILGRTVIWYNDIEDGFNTSSWTTAGVIDAYFCDQSDLRYVLESLANSLVDGSELPLRLGPPRPGLLGG